MRMNRFHHHHDRHRGRERHLILISIAVVVVITSEMQFVFIVKGRCNHDTGRSEQTHQMKAQVSQPRPFSRQPLSDLCK